MNCENCGGLTAPDVTGTVLRCRFCESGHFVGDGAGRGATSMHCETCGALPAPAVTGPLLRCRFCESVHFVGDGDGPDGLVLTGPESPGLCPLGCGPLCGRAAQR